MPRVEVSCRNPDGSLRTSAYSGVLLSHRERFDTQLGAKHMSRIVSLYKQLPVK
jgi:hypothetical protein